jgi:hypothetical protein
MAQPAFKVQAVMRTTPLLKDFSIVGLPTHADAPGAILLLAHMARSGLFTQAPAVKAVTQVKQPSE